MPIMRFSDQTFTLPTIFRKLKPFSPQDLRRRSCVRYYILPLCPPLPPPKRAQARPKPFGRLHCSQKTSYITWQIESWVYNASFGSSHWWICPRMHFEWRRSEGTWNNRLSLRIFLCSVAVMVKDWVKICEKLDWSFWIQTDCPLGDLNKGKPTRKRQHGM